MVSNRASAVVDLSAIEHNVATLAACAPHSELMAVVKADAYGHGLLEVARAAQRGGAQWLGVALLAEAIALRDAGIDGPILAWLPTPGDDFQRCIELDIDLSLAAQWMTDEVARAARAVGKTARVHLKIDTGLGRSGVAKRAWEQFLAGVDAHDDSTLDVVGIWSHLAYADSPLHPTISAQVAEFEDAVARARGFGIDPPYLHLANSAATLRLPQTHYNLVRPGIAIYGISPGEDVGTFRELGLRPAMTLSARLVATKRLPAGHGVSYAHQYVTTRETNVGLVPLGYADGIARSSSGRGPVLVAGERTTVAGRVCMDQFVIDVGDVDVEPGDEVILFGDGSQGEPTADDWARASDTIAYEIVTTIGPRVPRIYRGNASGGGDG